MYLSRYRFHWTRNGMSHSCNSKNALVFFNIQYTSLVTGQMELWRALAMGGGTHLGGG